jgi:hypothetical protein
MADEQDLVIVGSASGQLEALALREYLEANGVVTHIQGEHHNALLGSFGSFAIALNLMVPRGQLDEARELIEAFRAGAPAEDLDGEFDDGEFDEDRDAENEDERAGGVLTRMGRSKTKAMLLSVLPSFGMGHMYIGAFGRGFFLGMLELLGFGLLGSERLFAGGGLVLLSIAMDAIGSVVELGDRERRRTGPGPELPRAELRDR